MNITAIKEELFEIIEENIDIANCIDEGLSDLNGNFRDNSDTQTYNEACTKLIWAAVDFVLTCYSFDPNDWEDDD